MVRYYLELGFRAEGKNTALSVMYHLQLRSKMLHLNRLVETVWYAVSEAIALGGSAVL